MGKGNFKAKPVSTTPAPTAAQEGGMMNYTKGPWKIEDHIIVDCKGKQIASITPHRESEALEAIDQRDANAALIKSAPNMYEALSKAREDINWMLKNRQFLNPGVFDYLDEAIEEEAENG